MDASGLNTLFTPNGPLGDINLSQLAWKYNWTVFTSNTYTDALLRQIHVIKDNEKWVYQVKSSYGCKTFKTIESLDKFYSDLKPLSEFIRNLVTFNIGFTVCRNLTTMSFTKYCYIEIHNPDCNIIKTVHDFLDIECYKRYFIREAITNNGSINIWFYESAQAHLKHTKTIFKQQRGDKYENKENKYGLTYDQLFNLTKRAVARNMFNGDSLETALANPDIIYEFYRGYFVKSYIGEFGSDDQQNDMSENETKLNEIMSSIPDDKIHELLKKVKANEAK